MFSQNKIRNDKVGQGTRYRRKVLQGRDQWYLKAYPIRFDAANAIRPCDSKKKKRENLDEICRGIRYRGGETVAKCSFCSGRPFTSYHLPCFWRLAGLRSWPGT